MRGSLPFRWWLAMAGLLAMASSFSQTQAADLTPEEKAAGFVSLFDGRSLTGWQGVTDGYGVEDGVLFCRPESGGNLFTSREYADFVFRFEFKLSSNANNGLGIRCPLKGPAHTDGMELQIIDNGGDKYKTIKPWQHHGSLYGCVPAMEDALKPVGQWNQEEVTCIGPIVKVMLNGKLIMEADLDQVAARETIDGKPHPGLKRKSGYLGFLGHGSRVEFRNLRLKEVKH